MLFIPVDASEQLEKLMEEGNCEIFKINSCDSDSKWKEINAIPFNVGSYKTFQQLVAYVCGIYFEIQDYEKYRFICRNINIQSMQKYWLLDKECDRYIDGRRAMGKFGVLTL